MRYFAVITLLSGDQAYIAREGRTFEKSHAKPFRSHAAAEAAAIAYLEPLAPVVRRNMRFEIESEPGPSTDAPARDYPIAPGVTR